MTAAILLFIPAARAPAENEGPSTDPPKADCAGAAALEAAGEEVEARKAYIKLLEASPPPGCAREGLKRLNEAAAPYCTQGKTYEGLGREEQAIKAYEKALEVDPEADCAKQGLENVDPGGLKGTAEDASSFTSSVVELAGAVAAGIGVLLIALFVLLSCARVPRLGGLIRRLPGLGRLIGPRLSIEAIAEDATDEKPGAPIAAAIKEYLQVLRQEAISPLSEDEYDLDWPAPQEVFAEFVSGEPGLQNALEKASDISDQAKSVGAILGIVYATLPIDRLSLSGVAAPTHDGVGIAIALERNGRLTASTTIVSKAVKEPKVPDYVDLARPVAVWTQFGIGRILSNQEMTPEDAQSFALLRQGMDAAKKDEDMPAARAHLQEAIRLDSDNWAAYVAMASIPDKGDEHFGLVVSSLMLGLKEIARPTTPGPARSSGDRRWLTDERRHPRQRRNPRREPKLEDPAAERPDGLPYLADPNYYRMAYQLAIELTETTDEVRKKGPAAPEAKTIVKKLIVDAELMITWYRRREYLGEGQWWKRLKPKQRALLEFLRGTILPCLQIINADLDPGALGSERAKVVARRLKVLREEADEDKLSYRVLYNLACYEADADPASGAGAGRVVGQERQLVRAVRYLLAAVHRAPAQRRKALLARADSDKSLERVVADEDFKAERQVFEAPEESSKPLMARLLARVRSG